MKTQFLCVALLGSAAITVQANPANNRGGGAGFRGGAVAHAAPAAHTPARTGGVSSFHPMPARNFGGRSMYSGPRYSSFGMRSAGPRAFPQHSIYQNRATITRSGPYTVATIPQRNRVAPFTNRRNPAVTRVWNQRNIGTQFRNGNNLRNANNFRNGNKLRNANNLRNGTNHLRRDWQKHVFAHRSGDWHRDWNRNCNHWWNGHQCSFINGSWVIFTLGFSPWWPSYYPDDYYYDYGFPNDGYGSSTYGYDYPYSYNYDPGEYDSGNYQGQTYYDQNSYSDQSQGYYDSMVYQNQVDSDQNGNRDYSADEIVVAAQERLALQGYYRGETDGVLSPEMQKAVKRYQVTNGLRATGDLDAQTLAVMGLRTSASY
jgi:Putative peptidoglycan binding domain